VHGPRALDDIRENEPTFSDWSRVRELDASTEIAISVRQAPPVTRYFVTADEARMIVLNLSSPDLPSAASRRLRDLSVRRPDVFATLATTGGVAQDDVRLGRDGLFLANRKLAEFGQVVEDIPRADVTEIRGPVVARGSVSGAILGGWVGFGVGVVPGLGGVAGAAAWPILIGSVALGAYLGNRWSSHETDGIVYRRE
jgi:hypothetical protein